MFSKKGKEIIDEVNAKYKNEVMTGLRFQRVTDFDDVLLDGTVVGTVHELPGGWAFYAFTQTKKLPTSVGWTRYDAVIHGLRKTGLWNDSISMGGKDS